MSDSGTPAVLQLATFGAGGVTIAQVEGLAPALRGIVAVDVDRDGDDDLLFLAAQGAEEDEQLVPVALRNDGGDRFVRIASPPLGPWNPRATGVPAPSIAIGDFDHDGSPDMAVAWSHGPFSYEPDAVARYLAIRAGDGRGHFGPRTVRAPASTAPHSIIAGDFDGDGRDDIAGVVPGDGWLQPRGALVLLQQRAAGLLGHAPMPDVAAAAGYGVRELLRGDFDGDRRSDILSSGTVRYSDGKRSTGLYLQRERFVALHAGPDVLLTQGSVVADLDGDGCEEIVTASGAIHVYGVRTCVGSPPPTMSTPLPPPKLD